MSFSLKNAIAASERKTEAAVTSTAIKTVSSPDILKPLALAPDEGFEKTSGYTWYDDYHDDDFSIVNENKSVSIAPNQINVTQENNSQVIPFEMNRYYDGVDLTTMRISIYFVNANGDWSETPAINVMHSSTKIRFYWLLTNLATVIKGNVAFEIHATGVNMKGESYLWKTVPNKNGVNVLESLTSGNAIEPDDNWYTGFVNDMNNKVGEAQKYAQEAKDTVAQAQAAIDEVNEKITSVTEDITQDVIASVTVTLQQYYTKEEVDQIIEDLDFSSVLDEVQKKIDAIDGLANLAVEYDKDTNTMTFKNGEKTITSHVLETNPSEEWTSTFETSVQRSITEAVSPVSESLESYKIENDEKVTQAQGDIETLKSKASELDGLKNAVSTMESTVNSVDESVQQMTKDLTELESKVDQFEAVEPNEYDAGFEEETRTFTLYENGEPKTTFTISGGGGGGTAEGSVVTIERVTPASVNALIGDTVNIQYNFTSVDTAGDDTGNGTAVWSVGNVRVATSTAAQGLNTFNITDHLIVGSNKIKLTITDSVGNIASKTWTVTVIEFKIESTFDDSLFYSGDVTFRYIPYGDLNKTVHFELDGKPMTTVETPVTGRQLTQTITAQEHGAHLLKVYMTANLNNQDIQSTPVYKDIIWVDSENQTPIIGCAITDFTEKQYNSHTIPYVVYDPQHNPASITLSEDDNVLYTLTVERTRQVWSYRSADIGQKTLKITCGETVKEITADIEDIGVEIRPVQTNLAFDFNPAGRSNNDDDRLWNDNTYHMIVSDNFDWVNGGYQIDDEGDTYFCVKAGTTATIDYKLFGDDAKKSGKNFKVIYKATNVRDYDALVMKCKDGDIGFVANAQVATLSSALTSTSVQYCEDYYMEMEFNILPDLQYREMMFFMDAILCEPKIYDTSDNFTQANPQDITIGSPDCDVWIYRMKSYTMALTDDEILDNRIADAKNATEILNRFYRNQIIGASGDLDPDLIYENCPDLRVIKIECPTFTTGKKNEISDTTITHSYKNGRATEDNWTAKGSHKGQGTSSEYYGDSGRNIDINCSDGFTFGDGSEGDKYAMTENSVPEKYFNIKVNIASSENANNACNAQRYHQYNPYIREARQKNPKVRDTMEFHPCVIFIKETDTEHAVEFKDGKWHFYACGDFGNSKKNSDAMGMDPQNKKECIVEVLNNTSDQCRFLSDDFSDEQWDGNGSFEMRYEPDNLSEEESNALKESWKRVQNWVVNADEDTFKREFEDYFIKDSLLYTYLFTNRFMMVDNRAKNTFYHTSDGLHWDACFDYDNDTSMGNDNEGGLTLRYGYEDTDTIGNKSVFNASDSQLFCRIRDCFADDLAAMYVQLESTGVWSAERNLQTMEAYQAVKPERLVMADMRRKYLRPYEDNETTSYLAMAHGDKKHQRRQFEKYHEKYIASKYLGTVATSDIMTMRCYTPEQWSGVTPNGDMHITPYADMYVSVRYGNMTVQKRAKRGEVCDITCPIPQMNDTEVYVYTASMVRSIGDVSALYIGYCDFSLAVKLTELLIGSDVSGYSNTNMEHFTVGNNVLLEKINLRNLPNLRESLSLAGCSNLKELYAEGSGITGVVFSKGGNLRIAKIPAITTLDAKDLHYIETLEISGYENLTTLVVENCPDIDILNIIDKSPNLNRVRFTGIDWDLESDELLNKLLTMAGIDDSGYNSTNSVLAGKVHIPTVHQKLLETYESTWPDLEISYNSLIVQYAVTFQNYDEAVLDVQYVDVGGSAVDPTTRKDNPIPIPTKPSSVSTDYKFSGWDSVFTNVFSPRTITAQYSESVREYTVKYMNRNYTLKEEKAPYGSTVLYDGDTPTYTDEEGAYVFYLFKEWDKFGYVDGDKTINAVYDRFEYTDGCFGNMELSAMTPVQIYAMIKMRRESSIVEVKDSITFNMGTDYHYGDIKEEVAIESPTVFTGENYVDTGIKLLDEDKDWVLAIDYKWDTGNESRAVLAQCFQDDGFNGFRLWNSSSYRVAWGTSATTSAIANMRDVVVLRHVKGETKLHVYKGNLPAESVDYTTLTASRCVSSNNNTTLVFGCAKADDGYYENHAKGTVYWSKVWYTDLGDDACRALALWTHESINLEITGFRQYTLSDGSGKCSLSFLASHLLTNRMPLCNAGTNTGGWATTSLNAFLNRRFYEAIPTQWKQLIKRVKIVSTIGNKSTEISTSDCYVAIPAVAEVDLGMQRDPYTNEGILISYMTSSASRIRRFPDGTAGSAWLRSPNHEYDTYYYSINETGGISGYEYGTNEKGVLILLSF